MISVFINLDLHPLVHQLVKEKLSKKCTSIIIFKKSAIQLYLTDTFFKVMFLFFLFYLSFFIHPIFYFKDKNLNQILVALSHHN